MKVALVHDWLTGMRGGERCLQAFLSLYPDADIFTLVHIPGATNAQIDRRVKQVSFLNRIPGIGHLYRMFLPLYPLAIGQFDFAGYDLVVSLSHAAAKNVHVPQGVRHFCFCFTPMRYVWDQSRQYFGRLTPFLWPVISALRSWDRARSSDVSQFAAISRFIAARIRCYYGRRAKVIYPPVDTAWITTVEGEAPVIPATPAFLYAGALVPYKRVDLVVRPLTSSAFHCGLWVTGLKKKGSSRWPPPISRSTGM